MCFLNATENWIPFFNPVFQCLSFIGELRTLMLRIVEISSFFLFIHFHEFFVSFWILALSSVPWILLSIFPSLCSIVLQLYWNQVLLAFLTWVGRCLLLGFKILESRFSLILESFGWEVCYNLNEFALYFSFSLTAFKVLLLSVVGQSWILSK